MSGQCAPTLEVDPVCLLAGALIRTGRCSINFWVDLSVIYVANFRGTPRGKAAKFISSTDTAIQSVFFAV
jgi:hypothetical protein